ncbi:NSUN2 [Symbiodinium sp. CCMP2456]|nr:NSUN2 [Symbiodinium sp. CCMP2456]
MALLRASLIAFLLAVSAAADGANGTAATDSKTEPINATSATKASTAGLKVKRGGQEQGPDVVRILHISDTHSLHRSTGNMPDADILIHSGDVAKVGSESELGDFNDWLGSLKGKYKHILVISGNHDFWDTNWRLNRGHISNDVVQDPAYFQYRITNARVLNHDLAEVMGLKIWGAGWHARRGDSRSGNNYADIPEGVDIVVTHEAPFGIFDMTGGGHWGSSGELLDAIYRTKPKVHLSGHIHEQRGHWDKADFAARNSKAWSQYKGGVEYRHVHSELGESKSEVASPQRSHSEGALSLDHPDSVPRRIQWASAFDRACQHAKADTHPTGCQGLFHDWRYRVAILEHAKQTGCNDSQAMMDALLMRHAKKSDFPAMPFGYNEAVPRICPSYGSLADRRASRRRAIQGSTLGPRMGTTDLSISDRERGMPGRPLTSSARLNDCIFTASVLQLAACAEDKRTRQGGFWIGVRSLVTVFTPGPFLFCDGASRMEVATWQPPSCSHRPAVGVRLQAFPSSTPLIEALRSNAIDKSLSPLVVDVLGAEDVVPLAVLAVMAMLNFQKLSGLLLLNLVFCCMKIAGISAIRWLLLKFRLYTLDPSAVAILVRSEEGRTPLARHQNLRVPSPAAHLFLMCAAGLGETEILALLLNRGTDKAKEWGIEWGQTPLHLAAANGQLQSDAAPPQPAPTPLCMDLLLKVVRFRLVVMERFMRAVPFWPPLQEKENLPTAELEEIAQGLKFQGPSLQEIASDEEWPKLCHTLRQPLPISFRFTAQVSNVAEAEFREFLEELKNGCHTARGRFVPAPHIFDFAKVVSLGCDDRTLKQEQREAPDAPLARLGRWLSRRAPEGLVSRQEVVSAVPVALLGVEPGHAVLDVCAAPGSKTLQAIEKVCPAGDDTAGAVIANELSAMRARVLARRCALLGAAAGAVAVVQHKAQVFPGPGLFDRIICDVPCSGDGTMRKHPEKWRSWSPHLGRELHARQLQIALRGLALLQVGGQMTYSTCSFNPLENEAVVASLLCRTGGAVVLKRPPALEGLPVRPGLQHWEVVDEAAGRLASYQDIKRLPACLRRRYRSSMWPPVGVKDLKLQRCVRCVPFLANTGGFFVALLAKVREWPSVPATQVEVGESHIAKPLQLSKVLPEALAHSTGVPSLENGFLLSRGRRKLFYCSPGLDGILRASRRKALSLVAAGTCMALARDSGWQLTPSGLDIFNRMSGRKAEANARAAQKHFESHRCTTCDALRPASAFSRKMLTRPPSKRKSPAKQPDMAGAGDYPVEGEIETPQSSRSPHSAPRAARLAGCLGVSILRAALRLLALQGTWGKH